jgi:hypothetical protein
MTTDEMLIEIVEYDYKAWGVPYVFADYSKSNKKWSITWRNPVDFSNEKQTQGRTPNEACKKALKFIKNNPSIFSRSNEAGV